MGLEQYDQAGLATIAGGDAIARVDHEIERVLENCVDPNTDADKVREITLKIRVKPNFERTSAQVSYVVSAKLAHDAPGIADMAIVPSKEGVRGYVNKLRQLTFDDYRNNPDASTTEIIAMQARSRAGK